MRLQGQAARSKAHRRRVSALGNAAIRKAAMERADVYCMDATCRAATETAACPSNTWAGASLAGQGQINPYPSRRDGRAPRSNEFVTRSQN